MGSIKCRQPLHVNYVSVICLLFCLTVQNFSVGSADTVISSSSSTSTTDSKGKVHRNTLITNQVANDTHISGIQISSSNGIASVPDNLGISDPIVNVVQRREKRGASSASAAAASASSGGGRGGGSSSAAAAAASSSSGGRGGGSSSAAAAAAASSSGGGGGGNRGYPGRYPYRRYY